MDITIKTLLASESEKLRDDVREIWRILAQYEYQEAICLSAIVAANIWDEERFNQLVGLLGPDRRKSAMTEKEAWRIMKQSLSKIEVYVGYASSYAAQENEEDFVAMMHTLNNLLNYAWTVMDRDICKPKEPPR